MHNILETRLQAVLYISIWKHIRKVDCTQSRSSLGVIPSEGARCQKRTVLPEDLLSMMFFTTVRSADPVLQLLPVTCLSPDQKSKTLYQHAEQTIGGGYDLMNKMLIEDKSVYIFVHMQRTEVLKYG